MPHIDLNNHPELMSIHFAGFKANIVFKNQDIASRFSNVVGDYAMYGCESDSTSKDFFVFEVRSSILELRGNLSQFLTFLKQYDASICEAIEQNVDIRELVNKSKDYVLTEEDLEKACKELEDASKENKGEVVSAVKEYTPPQTPPPVFPQDLEGRSSTPPIKAH